VGVFVAHLAKINGVMFLDLFPAELNGKMNEYYVLHFRAVHSFLLVEQIEPRLRMSSMDLDWLETLLEQNPEAVRHETVNGEIVFTATTQELQTFLLKHVRTDGAYGDPSNMVRREAGR
jgi:hypothetical protein